MKHIYFEKAQALGNDFLIIDQRYQDISLSIFELQFLADRRLGIGCDQIIMIKHAQDPLNTAQVQFFNPDGLEAEACGNGSRCLALFLCTDILQELKVESAAGLLCMQVINQQQVRVTMPAPKILPLNPIVLPILSHAENVPVHVTLGNPHLVYFNIHTSFEGMDLLFWGKHLSSHPHFPVGINVSFAKLDGKEIDLWVWERGAGATLACGTAACATAVVAIHQKLVSSPVKVRQKGGNLTIDWNIGMPLTQEGEAKIVYKGEILMPSNYF